MTNEGDKAMCNEPQWPEDKADWPQTASVVQGGVVRDACALAPAANTPPADTAKDGTPAADSGALAGADPKALALAKQIVGDAFFVSHKENNEYLAQAREQGLDYKTLFHGPNSMTARSLVDLVADENLKVAPLAKIERKISSLLGKKAEIQAGSAAKFDQNRLGGSGAAGRQRDRASSAIRSDIAGSLAARLQAELDRRDAPQGGAVPAKPAQSYGKTQQETAADAITKVKGGAA